MQRPDNHLMVIFGASGDLTSRKLLPALARLNYQKLLPEKFAILGLGRTRMDDHSFRKEMSEALKKNAEKEIVSEEFISLLHYHSIDYSSSDDYSAIRKKIDKLSEFF